MSREGLFSAVSVSTVPTQLSQQATMLLDDDEAPLLLTCAMQTSEQVLCSVQKVEQTVLAGETPNVSPALKPSNSTATPPIPKVVSPEYTISDFAANSENQYLRYVPNSAKISHVLMRRDNKVAYQYSVPFPVGVPDVPEIKPLAQDCLYGFTLPTGAEAFQGKTVDGEMMISRRSYHLQITQGNEAPIDYTFYPLSPRENKSAFYGPSYTKRFLDTEESQKAIEKKPIYLKTSGELDINNEDIALRAEIKTRKPDQNTVMGGKNAVAAYKDFLEKYGHLITEELKTIMTEAAETPWQSPNIQSQKRPEWLHRHGFRLHPMNIDPQRVDNLGAARKCHNTAMMIPERTVERIIAKYPHAKAKISCTFNMLLDSEVVNTIFFYVIIQVGEFKVRFTQKIDALEKNPQFVKASDMATIVGILCMMIQNVAPRSAWPVSVFSDMPKFVVSPTRLLSAIPVSRPTIIGVKRENDNAAGEQSLQVTTSAGMFDRKKSRKETEAEVRAADSKNSVNCVDALTF